MDLTVAKYEGGAKTTKTYSFVNKSLRDSSSVATYWPILQSVGDISYTAGEIMPNVSLSSITLDNTVGSFGRGRKFSDILQPGYYSAVEQSIVVYVAQVANNSDTVSSWTQIASGVVSDWEAAVADGAGSLTINVKPFKIDEKLLTLIVEPSVSGMENAPASSLGRAVPLVIGDGLYVSPIRISADGATAPSYAVATGFYNHLTPTNVSSAATKNYDDEWEGCSFSAAITNTDYSGTTPTGSYTLNTYAGRAFKLDVTVPEVITGIQLQAKGNGSGGRVSTAYLSVQILRVDADTKAIVEEGATGRVQLSYYDTNNNAGTSNFAVKVSFDRPMFISVIEDRYEYYVAWEITGNVDGGAGLRELSLNYAAATSTELRKDTGDANNSYLEWKIAGTGNRPLYKLLKVTAGTLTYQVAAYTQTGLTYTKLSLEQVSPDTGQANPPLDTLQFLLYVIGLTDYGDSSPIQEVHTIINKLSYAWNGSAWTDQSAWDTTTLATTYGGLYSFDGSLDERARYVKAAYDQRVTFSQVVADICRGTASRVGVFSTGKLFTYPWGKTQTPTFNIPFADITALNWQQRDVSTIINRAVIVSGRSPLYSSDTGSDVIPDGYENSTDFSAANYPYIAEITAESRALYGQKDLGNGTLNAYGVDTLGNSMDEVAAHYYITRFSKPLVYASFIVPWHRYSSLKMFDVITFSTPAFSAYYGTDPDPRQNWVVDTGSEVTTVDVNSSYDLVQAQTYRGLVEGITYVMAMEHAPALKVTVLVLQNYATDPT